MNPQLSGEARTAPKRRVDKPQAPARQAALRIEFYQLPADALVDRETAAAVFYLKPVSFESLAIKGGGPSYRRIGRRALYRKGDLIAWAEAGGRTVENTAQLEAA